MFIQKLAVRKEKGLSFHPPLQFPLFTYISLTSWLLSPVRGTITNNQCWHMGQEGWSVVGFWVLAIFHY